MHDAFENFEVYGQQLPIPPDSRVKGTAQFRKLRSRTGRSPRCAFSRHVSGTLVIGAIGPEAHVDHLGFGRAVRAAAGRLARLEEESERGRGAAPSM